MFVISPRSRPHVSLVAAARPNFMKVGPVLRALETDADVELVHTGQHYDDAMSAQFFADLDLPAATVNLGVGSGSHAEQTAAVMVAYEKHLLERRPDAVVVVGDVNSTVACALTATKLGIPVAHVEAGLRSRDWTMPEEINRVVTDRLSRWLFTPSEDADQNLIAEGVPREWIHRVGNVMIDTLMACLPRAEERTPELRDRHRLPGRYGIVTLHRPSNVDEFDSLVRLLDALGDIGRHIPLVFPVHPRTRQRLGRPSTLSSGIRLVEPLGYLDFLALVSGASIVLTDSGGLQEETSVLGVPCLTLRDRTERPVTCELGTNVLVGTDGTAIIAAADSALRAARTPSNIPLWDGQTATRIAKVLLDDMISRGEA
jgi:UDP-N-acetylglucosamine 2-epimerase (non-hydrolysing)